MDDKDKKKNEFYYKWNDVVCEIKKKNSVFVCNCGYVFRFKTLDKPQIDWYMCHTRKK